jgi:hypothetical protein
MGYNISLEEAGFRISADNVPKALEALKAMPDKKYSWMNDNSWQGLDSFGAIMEEWRYPVEFDKDSGDVTGIDFEGEKIGDEVALFEALAPFVEKGSYIHMSGEDNAQWRWEFDGESLNENEARIVWDEEEEDEEDEEDDLAHLRGRQFIVVCGEKGEHHYEDETNLGEPVEIPGMDPQYFKPGTTIRVEEPEEEELTPLEALQAILEWSHSRDGSAEQDETVVYEIRKIAAKVLKVDPNKDPQS